MTLAIQGGIEPVIELFLASPKTTITMFDIISFPKDFENVELATKVFEFHCQQNKKNLDFRLLMLSNYNSQLAGDNAIFRLIRKPYNKVSFELIKMIISKDKNQILFGSKDNLSIIDYCVDQNQYVYASYFYKQISVEYSEHDCNRILFKITPEESENILYKFQQQMQDFSSCILQLQENVVKHSVRTDRLQEGLPIVSIVDEKTVSNEIVYNNCRVIHDLYPYFKKLFMKMLTAKQFYPNNLRFQKNRVQLFLISIIDVIANYRSLMDEIELRYKSTTTLNINNLYFLELFLIQAFTECRPNIFIDMTIEKMIELQKNIAKCPLFSIEFKRNIDESKCKCCNGKGKVRLSDFIDTEKPANVDESVDKDTLSTESIKKRKTTE